MSGIRSAPGIAGFCARLRVLLDVLEVGLDDLSRIRNHRLAGPPAGRRCRPEVPYRDLGVAVSRTYFWCRGDLRGDVLAGLFVLVLLVGHDSISIGCGCWAACG